MIQKGHCSCKQINYSFDNKKIINSFHCHCEDCQRSTGAGKASILVIKKSNFNLNGEPIVCSPKDAIRTFFSCGLDILVIGKFVIEK